MSALDGRAPFVLDVRELGRRAGAMLTLAITQPAPADLHNPMIGVPEGSDVAMNLMAESVIEGVLITGTVEVTIAGSCSRCLEPVTDSLEVDIEELFRYADLDDGNEDDDNELPTLDDDLINIEPTLRDAVVLALPLAPVCSEECQGLCPDCGIRLADEPGHQHEQLDPRWAALTGLLTETNSGESREEDVKD